MLIVGGLVYLAFVGRVLRGSWLFVAVWALVMIALGLLLLWLGQGIAKLLEWVARIPWRYRWAFLAAILLIFFPLRSMKPGAALAIGAALLLAASLAGAGIGSLWRNGDRLNRVQRTIAVVGVILGMVAMIFGLGWYAAWRGPVEKPLVNAARQSGLPLAQVTLPDPSRPGPYIVKTLTYGSGRDRYRPEYGAKVGIRTQPVDGTPLLEGSWQGFSGALRTLAWGFGPQALPLNGRVWYPEGKGPFPLVLVVHGNHNMMDFSDPGYDYLGELLASRGFILVSVDENFLNGGITDLLGDFSKENDARGWLLLEHLRLWQAWNQDASNPFYSKVEMQRIALMGHSRGGEAAAVAAAFNRLPCYPDNAEQVFDYNYNIRAVVAIAPIDGQYRPALRPNRLSDVNYFVLHGSHDADVYSFDGLDQYQRVRFTPGTDWFKAALYVYRANHGQFNTRWGADDLAGLNSGFINHAALLAEEDQTQIARLYISAFLEAALNGQRGYLPLFQDARAAGEGWLPDTIYINRFEQAGDRLIATFEEDVNLLTTTLSGGKIVAQNLPLWREQRIHTKWGNSENGVVYLGWNEEAAGFYAILLPASGLSISASDALIFNLADAGQDPLPEKEHRKSAEGHWQEADLRQPLDLTLVLEDANGQTAAAPLSRYLSVQPQLRARVLKLDVFGERKASEPILQSYVLPLVDFVEVNPAFQPEQLRAIRFVFDRSRRGSLILDEVGLRELSDE